MMYVRTEIGRLPQNETKLTETKPTNEEKKKRKRQAKLGERKGEVNTLCKIKIKNRGKNKLTSPYQFLRDAEKGKWPDGVV